MQNPNALHEAIGEMIATMRSDRHMNECETSTLIYSMLMKLMEQGGCIGAGGMGNLVVDRAIAYIHNHLTEKLTVETIAANVGYSASYFSRIFAEEMGMSPYQFVVKSRIEQAQLLLKTTQLTIQEVAFQCGFNSAANFCYTFRKHKELSPHAYRKLPF